MQIYLPIAEIPVSVFLILGLGLFTGILAGTFGVGGGFLATPFLIFIGIPPAIAVSTSANQIIASSISGLLAHLRKGNVDVKMGWFLVIGGFIGSILGIIIFKFLQKLGHADMAVNVIYALFFGSISLIMLVDSGKAVIEQRYNIVFKKKQSGKLEKFLTKIDNLPFQIHFPKSEIKASLIVLIAIGIIIGILVSLMGVGGGFIAIPAMLYILRMPSNVVIGTSLFQIIFTASNATFLQAVTNNSVDIVLALLMIVTSAIGAQFGTRVSSKFNPYNLKLGLSLLILAICVKMFLNLLAQPASLYTIEMLR